MNTIKFDHRQTAHCESGVLSSLLRHAGLDLSEPMVFGIAGALMYAYVPIIKMGGLPLIAYRSPPGSIIRRVTRRLGIEMHVQRFRDRLDGMETLDRFLEAGQPVGMQTSAYWLPYFPKEMRFHFNAHNLVAYSRDKDEYLISDPTFEVPVRADYQSLQRARFVKGVLAPKGLIYYPKRLPSQLDLRKAIRRAIKSNTGALLHAPLPFVGIRGIRRVSRKLRQMANDPAQREKQNKLFIGHVVRMQEEIGTGGAGFRFLYASFLQEAAEVLDRPVLETVSQAFTDTGDEWRRFALFSARMCKDRMALDYHKLADQLLHVASLEKDALRQLRAAV